MQRCPQCDEPIEAESINIKEGVALCPSCSALSRLSELTWSTRSQQEILADTPAGCSVAPVGRAVEASASLRAIGRFIGIAALALFWNGIVSVFVCIAAVGLYTNLVGPLPAWFPAPGMIDGKVKMNDGPMELGGTLFLCLFLVPFVAVGTGLLVLAVVSLIGRVRVVIDEEESYVSTGVGLLRWKRRFVAAKTTEVKGTFSSWETNGEKQRQIELVADRTLKFGSMLPDERREWLRVVLRKLLLNADGKPLGSTPPDLSWITQRP